MGASYFAPDCALPGFRALVATPKTLETEIRTLPDFSHGLVVGLAVSAVLLLSMRPRSS